MTNKFIALALLIIVSIPIWAFSSSSSCKLLIDQPRTIQKNLGVVTFSEMAQDFIWLSPAMGDISAFNFDSLFKLTNSISTYYFRMNGRAYNHTGTGQTFLYEIAWGGGRFLVPEYI